MTSSPTTSTGIQTSFGNTPQASNDLFYALLSGAQTFNVMANDLGGNAKTLWSIDNASSLGGIRPTELLTQDTARAEATSSDTSLLGAKIWITDAGQIGYDSFTLLATIQNQIAHLSQGEVLTDTFTYAIRLGNGTLSWATATVEFVGQNQNPVAISDSAFVNEDTPSSAVSSNVLTNDTDVNSSDTHSVTAVNGSAENVGGNVAGTYGTLHLNADGSYTYTLANDQANVQALAAGQQATDTFTYTNSDNHGGSSSTTLIVTINGTNDAPVAVADTNSGLEDATITGTVAINDSDVDTGATLSYALDAPVAGLTLSTDGSYSFDAGNAAFGTMNVPRARDERSDLVGVNVGAGVNVYSQSQGLACDGDRRARSARIARQVQQTSSDLQNTNSLCQAGQAVRGFRGRSTSI